MKLEKNISYRLRCYWVKGLRSITIIYLMFIFNNISAQIDKKLEALITINENNVELIDVLHKIENQSGLQFIYNEGIVDVNKKVTVSFNNSKVIDVLEKLFNDESLDYEFDNEYTLITTKSASVHADKIEDQNKQTTRILKGIVVGENSPNEGLPGANIMVEGTSHATITDSRGFFELEVQEEDVLIISFIGYERQRIRIKDQTFLNIVLSPELTKIEELVVIGYGQIKKSDVTGSLASVSSTELNSYPTSGVTQALQGRAAGLHVQSNNGGPGGDYKVRIRGGTSINASSEPLYVVDGFPAATSPPAENIQSIEILKDASATAIYGSRGANGVIMITTKRGKEGEMKVDFAMSHSFLDPVNQLELLNGEQFATYINTVEENAYREPIYEDPASFGEGTNWQDEIIRQGSTKNYSLSVSGGNKRVKFYGSGVYYNDQGLIINSFYNRLSLTSNVDVNVSEKVKLGANLFIRRSNSGMVKTQETSSSANNIGIIGSAYKFEPTVGIYDEYGEYTTSNIGDPKDNPYALATERTNDTQEDRTQSNIFTEVDILKSLKFRSNLGVVISNSRNGKYIPTTLLGGRSANGIAELLYRKKTTLVNENYFTYTKEIFDIHDINFVAGYSYENVISESFSSANHNFINDAGLYWNLAGGSELQIPKSQFVNSELSSFYGRLNYKINDRYIFTLTNRFDGSSKFSINNKWAYFPSGAFAWNAGNEQFLQDNNYLSTLKFRISYGITGNQAINAYESLASLGIAVATQQGKLLTGVAPETIANNDLTWESTAQLNVGTDIGLLKGRIYLTMDYYDMITDDLLFEVNLPEYSGFQTLLTNAGKVQNTGLELGLNARVLTGKLKWKTVFNISKNRNEILELAESEDILYSSLPNSAVLGGENQILRVGQPVGMFYGFVYEGVLQEGEENLFGGETVGGEKFKDQDNDGTLTYDDRDIIGNPHPDFIFGLNNLFQFKGFELDIFIQGVVGNEIVNMTKYELDGLIGKSNATIDILNSWTPDNTQTDVPQIRSRPARFSSRWVEDGSFIRLKSLSLAYKIPGNILKPKKIRNVRLFISGQNLLTFTNYSGVDPEVNFRSSKATDSNRNLGLDYASYPLARSISIGIDAGF